MIKIDDYCKDDEELNEGKFIEDLAPIFLLIAFKEEKIKNLLNKAESKDALEIIIEYYTKRKELADEYVKKLEESK